MSARNRELFALIPVALLVTGGFAAVFIVQSNQIGDLSLTYGAYFLAVCIATHVLIRIRLPYADPYLFPLVALLAAGSVFGARQMYFLGVDEGGRMALYRGLPYDLPLGISLYDERYSSPVQFASLPPELQSNVTDHELRSHDDAASLISEYEDVAETAAAERTPSGGGGGGKANRGGRKQQGGKKGRSKRGDRGGGGRKRSGDR